MKVGGVGPTNSAQGPRRSEKSDAKAGGFSSLLSGVSDAAEASAVETPMAVGGIDALLAAQSVDGATDREARRRAIRRGEDILDKLEEIRHGLLMGTIDKDRLVQLAQLVRSRRDSIDDPRLAALLDEIELRAEVELAKLSRDA